MAADTSQSWVIASQKEDLSGLVFKDVTSVRELGAHDVRVELRAASLNYRDLVIAKVSHNAYSPLRIQLTHAIQRQ